MITIGIVTSEMYRMILGWVQSFLGDGEKLCGEACSKTPPFKLGSSWGDKIKLAVKGIDF